MKKTGQFSFEVDTTAKFFGTRFLEGCSVTTGAGSIECDIIIIPKKAYKDAKGKMDENGDIQASKGVRMNISSKGKDDVYGMSFDNGIGVQLSVYKMNEQQSKGNDIFSTEDE